MSSAGTQPLAFAREKRLMLGVLALVAPLPLPWNEVLEIPVALLYGVAVLLFLRRAWRGAESWLPGWALNALGLAYLPVLYADLLLFWGGQLVRPVIHLGMFAVGVKLFSLRQERDKWHVVIGAFFLFLAAMGTSVHPVILLYLIVFLVLALGVLARFAWFSVLARFGYRRDEPAPVPLRGFLVAAALGSMLLAAPLFALLPRIRAPYITMRGPGTGTIIRAAGFSDEISLDSIGSTRIGRQVLLRLRFYPRPTPRGEIRIKASTYDRYDGRSWHANQHNDPIAPQFGSFRLSRGRAVQDAEIWLLPWNSPALPLPVEAVGVNVRALAIGRDRGGAVALYSVPAETLRYEVELGPRPALDELPDPLLDAADPTLGTAGVTPRIAALAAQQMGTQGDLETRVARLEQFLATRYTYTTEFVGRAGQLSLEDFLFKVRRGHCEFFATAMVIMLRSQHVPARLVTGFLGGDQSDFEGYYIVRQSNAHAWVEAWIPDRGWRVFDPTPAAGRPGEEPHDLSRFFSEAWDYVHFRWDRYVLTYGFTDQLTLFFGLRAAWTRFWHAFQHNPLPTPAPGATAGDATTAVHGPAKTFSWHQWRLRSLYAIGVLALLVLAWTVWERRFRRRTATETYARLRERLETSGVAVPESLAPLALVRRAGERFPAVAAPTGTLVDLYLRESFAGEELAMPELELATASLREVERVLAKAG